MLNIEVKKKDKSGRTIRVFVGLNERTQTLFVRDVGITEKGKRKVNSIEEGLRSDYQFRSLDGAGRKNYFQDKVLSEVSVEFLEEALEEAWLKLKPVGGTVFR